MGEPSLKPERQWAELLGTLGIIASLIFVGLELRQNTLATTSETINGLRDGATTFSLTLASDPELALLHQRWTQGETDFTEVETARIGGVVFAFLRTIEAAYLQTALGIVGDDVLRGYGISSSPTVQNDNFRALWPTIRHRFNPEFVADFEELNDLR